MPKRFILVSLVAVSLIISAGCLSAQTGNVQSSAKTQMNAADSAKTYEVESDDKAEQKTNSAGVSSSATSGSGVSSMNKTTSAMPVVSTTPVIRVEVPEEISAYQKCGVNAYSITNECGANSYKNMYVQCYDGYEERQGGDSSCKSPDTWWEYANVACKGHCKFGTSSSGSGSGGSTGAMTGTATVGKTATVMTPSVSVCSMNDVLMREYDDLIVQMQSAKTAAEQQAVNQKISELKQEMIKGDQICSGVSSIAPSTSATTITINRCGEAEQWQEKLAYYQKVSALSDEELLRDYNYSRGEVDKILSELQTGLEKIKVQCTNQNTLTPKPAEDSAAVQSVLEPVKPVAAQSAEEINDYYKVKIRSITTSNATTSQQVQDFKALKQEVNSLTSDFVKSRKEIEASELSNLAGNITVSRGEIKADEVIVETTGKKILFNFGTTSASVEPTAKNVIIQENNTVTNAREVSIKDGVLNVGNSQVSLPASQVAAGLNIAPTSFELKEENSQAVYKMNVQEPMKILGLIPVNVNKTVTANADNGNLIREQLPWYSFLMTNNK